MISLDDIRAAQARIDGVAVKTPLVPWADAVVGEQWFFKPESLQPIGAFKLRGGYNKIASLTAEQRANAIWKRMLRDYQAPAIDEAVDESLRSFIEQRNAELPDASY